MDSFNSTDIGGRSGPRGAFLYTLASGIYFEDLQRASLKGDYKKSLQTLVPGQWTIKRGGLWYHTLPPEPGLPPNGFKLHISATLDNAKALLTIVVPICVEEKVTFKVLRSANFLAMANSKFFPRASAHKFITIYPKTTEHFLELAQTLRAATRDFSGPYILSDKPVDGSKVVFYRYGGFVPHRQLTVKGNAKLCIKSPGGEWVSDQRVPYFFLPDGISDPLGDNATTAAAEQIVLHDRYRIKEAITFSNCGGTYLATDLKSGDEVLIKEARPLTTISHIPKWRFYADDAIVREQKVLEKLKALTCVPNAVEVFREGEHAFAVQQFIDACSFAQYRAQDSVLLAPFDGNRKKARRFCEAFKAIGISLVRAVLAIHRRKVIVGDISPHNILVDEQQNVYLVDFESAWDYSWSSGPDELSSVWMTPGFRPRKKGSEQEVTYRDDWYAVSMVLFSMLLPVSRLNTMSPGAFEPFMAAMVEAACLPAWVPKTIRLLIQGKPVAALKRLEIADIREEPATRPLLPGHAGDTAAIGGTLEQRIEDTLSGINRHLLETCDTRRSDRLWPPDYTVFTTNPMSIAYGACGTAHYLHTATGKLPEKADRWLCKRELSEDRYPPGLYLGLSGIAWSLWQLGHEQRAHDALVMALESDLLYADWSIFYGAAGCGLACLQMYLWSGDDFFIDKASEIGAHMIKAGISTDAGLGWKDADNKMLKPGYAFGGSGIALFLLYLSQITQQTKFLSAARNALEHDIAAASTEFADGLPRWTLNDKPGVWSPYWLEGGCGIGGVIIRFFAMLQEGRYLKLAHEVARANYSRFTMAPAQFEGLSGIGDFMLDMHWVTRDSGFERKARHIAEGVLLYAITKDEGVMFPGRYLSRISDDFGYGSAGIGLFLNRYLHGNGRWLHDLDGLEGVPVRHADGKTHA